jgi:hypothetical protein
MGRCVQTTVRDMNSITSERCFAYLSTSSALTSDNLLSVINFISSNGLNSSMSVYAMESSSTGGLTPITAASVSTSCTVFNSTISQCYVVKQIKLFFIKSTSITVDYTSSYIVVGQTNINTNSPSYIKVNFCYQFISQAGNYAVVSNQGYTPGAPLVLLYASTTTSTYYRVFNPINLAFKKLDGTCTTTSTDITDPSNLI